MPANKKLTHVIAGRTITGTSQADGICTLTLDDGSTLQIKVASSDSNTGSTGGKIAKVREDGPAFHLDLEGGTSIDLTLANPGNSVALRDKNHKVEYMG